MCLEHYPTTKRRGHCRRHRRRRHEAVGDAARGERRAAEGGHKVGAAAVVAVGRPAGRAKACMSAAPAAAPWIKRGGRTL